MFVPLGRATWHLLGVRPNGFALVYSVFPKLEVRKVGCQLSTCSVAIEL